MTVNFFVDRGEEIVISQTTLSQWTMKVVLQNHNVKELPKFEAKKFSFFVKKSINPVEKFRELR